MTASATVIAGRPGSSARGASSTVLLLLLAFTRASAGDGPPYPSSVVGTDFDFITESDLDTFVRLEDNGQGPAEMPDKSDRSAPLVQQAFLFVAHFNDGTRVNLAIDRDFQTPDSARKEALRYTSRLGKLPTALRRGVDRVVVPLRLHPDPSPEPDPQSGGGEDRARHPQPDRLRREAAAEGQAAPFRRRSETGEGG